MFLNAVLNWHFYKILYENWLHQFGLNMSEITLSPLSESTSEDELPLLVMKVEIRVDLYSRDQYCSSLNASEILFVSLIFYSLHFLHHTDRQECYKESKFSEELTTLIPSTCYQLSLADIVSWIHSYRSDLVRPFFSPFFTEVSANHIISITVSCQNLPSKIYVTLYTSPPTHLHTFRLIITFM